MRTNRDQSETPDEFRGSFESQEEWRAVVGYEACYQVSNLGRVRSLARMKPLVGWRDRWDYHRVVLWTPAGQATARVHRVVCEAFHGPPNVLHREVAHLDGNPRNNEAGNLKWVSHAENMSHKRWHGTNGAGEKHHRAKLTDSQAKTIVAELANGAGCRRLAIRFGVSPGAIESIKRGKNWRHIPRPPMLARSTGNGQNGANNHMAALTWDQAIEIRRRRAAGETASDLRREFGISKAAIYKLLAGETYRYRDAA